MKFFSRLSAIAVLLLSSLPVQAYEQYRSKQLIDPDNNLNESATLTIQELESSLHTMENDYAKSSTQRHLARHYVQNKEYDKAIQYYEDAIAEGGLSVYANTEMLQELIQVYMLKPDYRGAINSLSKYESQGGKLNTNLYLIKAHASFEIKDFVTTSESLDKAMASSNSHDSKTLNRALSLYYQIGNYQKSADILEQLLKLNPHEPETWRRLASMHIKLGRRDDALVTIALAWEKNIPFRHQDVVLLSDLYASSNNPHKAARILEIGIERQLVQPNAKEYQRLFNYWLQAREKDKALVALQKAADMKQDTELELYLAQLYMEGEEWRKMQDTILKTCQQHLKDKYVSRANLLLGISQLKLGDEDTARRSFINATLIGGEGELAGRYLRYMNAKPPTEREKAYINGPCQSQSTATVFASLGGSGKTSSSKKTRVDTSPAKTTTANTSTSNKPAGEVKTKTTPRMNLFYGKYTMSSEEFEDGIAGEALKLGLSAVKSGATVEGPMYLIFEEPFEEGASEITFKMALPVSGRPKPRGRYKVSRDKGFKCVYTTYEGKAEDMMAAWKALAESAKAAGYELTGESRQLFGQDNEIGSDIISTELQLGIK